MGKLWRAPKCLYGTLIRILPEKFLVRHAQRGQETRDSFVPRLAGGIWKLLIQRDVADSGLSQQKRARDLDSIYVWIPKLDVAGANPVSRSIFSISK